MDRVELTFGIFWASNSFLPMCLRKLSSISCIGIFHEFKISLVNGVTMRNRINRNLRSISSSAAELAIQWAFETKTNWCYGSYGQDLAQGRCKIECEFVGDGQSTC